MTTRLNMTGAGCFAVANVARLLPDFSN